MHYFVSFIERFVRKINYREGRCMDRQTNKISNMGWYNLTSNQSIS